MTSSNQAIWSPSASQGRCSRRRAPSTPRCRAAPQLDPRGVGRGVLRRALRRPSAYRRGVELPPPYGLLVPRHLVRDLWPSGRVPAGRLPLLPHWVRAADRVRHCRLRRDRRTLRRLSAKSLSGTPAASNRVGARLALSPPSPPGCPARNWGLSIQAASQGAQPRVDWQPPGADFRRQADASLRADCRPDGERARRRPWAVEYSLSSSKASQRSTRSSVALRTRCTRAFVSVGSAWSHTAS